MVYHAPFATLALVHGACYGAAADLIAACHFRVASPDARFRLPGLRFGLVLGTRRLAELVGEGAARALLMRAEPFNADQALQVGFVQEVAAPGEWHNIERRVTADVLGLSDEAFAAMASRTRESCRDADLAALVRSAASGSIRERIRVYLNV